MKISRSLIQALQDRSDWFTVTRVTVRVSPALGGYMLDVDAAIQDTLGAMEASGELSEIVSVSGIAHPPDHSWAYAFRVDNSGTSVAANAPSDAVQMVAPHLKEATSL